MCDVLRYAFRRRRSRSADELPVFARGRFGLVERLLRIEAQCEYGDDNCRENRPLAEIEIEDRPLVWRFGHAIEKALRKPQHVERAEHDAADRADGEDKRIRHTLLVRMPRRTESAEQHEELASKTAGRREPDRGQRQDHEEYGVD